VTKLDECSENLYRHQASVIVNDILAASGLLFMGGENIGKHLLEKVGSISMARSSGMGL
jgi:hypothetical protein